MMIRRILGRRYWYNLSGNVAFQLYFNYSKSISKIRSTSHEWPQRRTGATLLADSGADFVKVEQLGGWNSDKICHGYVENSSYNRKQIFNGVTHKATATVNSQFLLRPSTSKDTTAQIININQEHENESSIPLDCNDFADEMTLDNHDNP
ncbi:uncharacterized protein LOC117177252 [Belonocnema kinseyi]|uniref:uncharacterized protein LOC117177252 n=1 Tax=Belonocnema kinseyi TaxID=2817044 RepID=UPI00143D62A9|nr:uncharacterized protein LOC117177252 [Belonocnema kinseyi]